jgi:hypothetical protein
LSSPHRVRTQRWLLLKCRNEFADLPRQPGFPNHDGDHGDFYAEFPKLVTAERFCRCEALTGSKNGSVGRGRVSIFGRSASKKRR